MEVLIKDLGLLINAILIATPPLLLAALGSCFSERSGVINIGIEGMMTIGAFIGACVAYFSGNGWLGFFAGGLSGAILGVIHAVACIQFGADQTISGTAINFIGPGLAVFLCKAIFDNSSDSPALDTASKLPKLFDGMFPSGSFGYNVFSTYIVAYLSFILVAVVWFVFYKTKFGMHLRAVGEHPQACATLGVNVYRTRYICVILSGFLAGLGGAFVTLATVSQFRPAVIVGQGFIAIAAVIFGKFKPQGAFKACLLFGLCNGIKALLGAGNAVSPNLVSMIPYVVTILALVFVVGKMLSTKLFDHTILKADATRKDVKRVCDEAMAYSFCSVCVNSYYVPYVANLLHGSDVKICSVVGFPLGAMSTRAKALEAKIAVMDGADEIDMVINVGALKDRDYSVVLEDIKAVKEACGEHILKVIIETCLLTDDEKVKACELAKEAGADFVKTSTGFSSAGAKVEDVRLMRETVGPDMGVKASGGIHDKEFAKELVDAGANRLGTSATIEIVESAFYDMG